MVENKIQFFFRCSKFTTSIAIASYSDTRNSAVEITFWNVFSMELCILMIEICDPKMMLCFPQKCSSTLLVIIYIFQGSYVYGVNKHISECHADFAKNKIDKCIADFREQMITTPRSDISLAAAYKAAIDSLDLSSYDKANKVPVFNNIKSAIYTNMYKYKSEIENMDTTHFVSM